MNAATNIDLKPYNGWENFEVGKNIFVSSVSFSTHVNATWPKSISGGIGTSSLSYNKETGILYCPTNSASNIDLGWNGPNESYGKAYGSRSVSYSVVLVTTE